MINKWSNSYPKDQNTKKVFDSSLSDMAIQQRRSSPSFLVTWTSLHQAARHTKRTWWNGWNYDELSYRRQLVWLRVSEKDKFVTKIYNFQPAIKNKVYPGKTSISSGKCWLEDETSFWNNPLLGYMSIFGGVFEASFRKNPKCLETNCEARRLKDFGAKMCKGFCMCLAVFHISPPSFLAVQKTPQERCVQPENSTHHKMSYEKRKISRCRYIPLLLMRCFFFIVKKRDLLSNNWKDA